jgi:hypothetical protein
MLGFDIECGGKEMIVTQNNPLVFDQTTLVDLKYISIQKENMSLYLMLYYSFAIR